MVGCNVAITDVGSDQSFTKVVCVLHVKQVSQINVIKLCPSPVCFVLYFVCALTFY